MRLSTTPVHAARDGGAMPVELDRTAAVMTLMGCVLTGVACILPWGERATFGFSLTTIQGQNARILFGVLALASVGVTATVLFRRAYSAGAALLLLGLALAEVGAGTWFGITVVNEIRATHPQLVMTNAIGTGVYIVGLGSIFTLIGAVRAWTRRRSGWPDALPLNLAGVTTADADGDADERLPYN